jgi:hypothetical protein
LKSKRPVDDENERKKFMCNDCEYKATQNKICNHISLSIPVKSRIHVRYVKKHFQNHTTCKDIIELNIKNERLQLLSPINT